MIRPQQARAEACPRTLCRDRILGRRRVHNVTPSFQIEISRKSLISLRVRLRPLATSKTSENSPSASVSKSLEPSAIGPASKSIQLDFFLARSEFVLILIVGAGNPIGVP